MPPFETPPAPARESLVDRIEKHPYLLSAIAAILLLLIGLAVLLQRVGTSASSFGNAWQGAGGMFSANARVRETGPALSAEQTVKDKSPEAQLGYIPIAKPLAGLTDETSEEPSDLAALLLSLSRPASPTPGQQAPTESAFSFIPSGLISTSSPLRRRTPLQDSIHNYGNVAGGVIQSFEDMYPGAPQLLKDHAEERTNAEKAKKLEDLGIAYARLGVDLLQIPDVPEEMKKAHTAYATTYRILGTNLTKIAKTTDDNAFLDAIAVFNASSEDLTKRFLVIIGLFSAHDVTFSSDEPGSVFMFNPNLSL